LRDKNNILSKSDVSEIKSFYSSSKPSVKPSFHSWIQIDDLKILDVVGPAYLEIGISYFDEINASKHDVYYHEVLSHPDDVQAFYNRLLIGTQVSEWH